MAMLRKRGLPELMWCWACALCDDGCCSTLISLFIAHFCCKEFHYFVSCCFVAADDITAKVYISERKLRLCVPGRLARWSALNSVLLGWLVLSGVPVEVIVQIVCRAKGTSNWRPFLHFEQHSEGWVG